MSEQIAVEEKAGIERQAEEAKTELFKCDEQLTAAIDGAVTISDVEKSMRECEQRLFFLRQLSRDTDHYKDFPLSVLNDARRAIMVVERATLDYELSANKIAEAKDKVETARTALREIEGQD